MINPNHLREMVNPQHNMDVDVPAYAPVLETPPGDPDTAITRGANGQCEIIRQVRPIPLKSSPIKQFIEQDCYASCESDSEPRDPVIFTRKVVIKKTRVAVRNTGAAAGGSEQHFVIANPNGGETVVRRNVPPRYNRNVYQATVAHHADPMRTHTPPQCPTTAHPRP